GRDWGNRRSPEGRRRRGFDLDGYELTGLRGAREVDGGVPARAAAEPAFVRPAGTLDKHLLDPSDPLLVPCLRNSLDDLDQPLDPLVLELVGHLVGHLRGFGAVAR